MSIFSKLLNYKAEKIQGPVYKSRDKKAKAKTRQQKKSRRINVQKAKK